MTAQAQLHQLNIRNNLDADTPQEWRALAADFMGDIFGIFNGTSAETEHPYKIMGQQMVHPVAQGEVLLNISRR